VAAIEAFDPAAYDPARIREHALQWDRPAFRSALVAAVAAAVGGHTYSGNRHPVAAGGATVATPPRVRTDAVDPSPT
jgi:hypothetical protein